MVRLQEDFSGLFGGEVGAVRGRMLGREARVVRRIFYQNSFRTVVSVSVADNRGNAIVQTVAGVSMPVRILMLAWFGFLLLFCSLALQGVAGGSPVEGDWIYFVLVPGGMFLFGFALVTGCRYLARDDEAVILAYLRRRLEAA
ncbi:hypothetical protein [Brevundimonas sp. Root1279]|uniref:hypothetical protein n=1 Tax=Brevundimonas sp. Root1279 TaxID=1736443 RepID=UPI0012E34863|nr:hypothetical protein [Brevundimonas sp. Root1279]